MKIELTEKQFNSFLEDQYINIQIGDYDVYFEIDDKLPSYFEIRTVKKGIPFKPVAHSIKDLRKLEPLRPDDPSYYHNDPLCPSCKSYMMYHFEHCPKCGQKLDWSEKTDLI